MADDDVRLDIFELARALHIRLDRLLRNARWRRDLVNQALRAAASAALNIEEGAAEYSPKEKARFYRLARRSAAETRGCLLLLMDCGVITATNCEECRRDYRQLIARLVLLSKSMERRLQTTRQAKHEKP